jgi:hypothetical protein
MLEIGLFGSEGGATSSVVPTLSLGHTLVAVNTRARWRNAVAP